MRRDGKKIKVQHVEYALTPHIMPDRCDAMNMCEVDIPLKPMQDYLNAKRKEGHRISHLALIMAAYVRLVGEFPELNRFIVNKKVYARNELIFGMVVLKAGQMDNGTMSKVNFDPADTIFDVNRKITEYIEVNRKDGDNSTDKLAKFLLKIPGLLRFGVNLLKWMDKHGWLPRAIIDASPFHATMSITNLASIRTQHVYHHVYNFGTTSVFLAMGKSRDIPKQNDNGEIYLEKCMPIGVVMDERICSGSYYSSAFKKFIKYLEKPELLEVKPDPDKVTRETKYRKDRYPEK